MGPRDLKIHFVQLDRHNEFLVVLINHALTFLYSTVMSILNSIVQSSDLMGGSMLILSDAFPE